MYTHSDLITSKHRIPGFLLIPQEEWIDSDTSSPFPTYVELDIELEMHALSLFPLPHNPNQ